MRLRNIKGSREYIEQSPFVVHDPEQYRGRWRDLFHNPNPLHVEVGMGKGRFLLQLARENPDTNYLGIEMYSSVLYRAIERRAQAEENHLDNLFFLRFDAKYLSEIFAPGDITRIYLNFSDPWPKERHAGRRLTSPGFLSEYHRILAPSGHIQFKTDNRELFNFSVKSVQESGTWHIDELTYDLRNSEFLEGNVMTEYECRFTEEGRPICRFLVSKNHF